MIQSIDCINMLCDGSVFLDLVILHTYAYRFSDEPREPSMRSTALLSFERLNSQRRNSLP